MTRGGRIKAVGWHHKPSALNSDTKILEILDQPNRFGVYRAKAQVEGITKVSPSTFFPDNWSQQKVIDKINEAYSTRIPVPDKYGAFKGTTSEGMEIFIGTISDPENPDFGKIASAYPYYK